MAVGPSVRVLQMNVLADRLAPPSAFPHTDPAVLTWAHRKDLLLQQITSLDPDVVCLEVWLPFSLHTAHARTRTRTTAHAHAPPHTHKCC